MIGPVIFTIFLVVSGVGLGVILGKFHSLNFLDSSDDD